MYATRKGNCNNKENKVKKLVTFFKIEKIWNYFKDITSLVLSIVFLAGGLVLVNFLSMFSILSTVTNYVSYAIGIGIGILIYKVGGLKNTDKTNKILEDNLKQKAEEAEKLIVENNILKSDRDRLKKQKISITDLESIFKISLFNIKTTITDLRREAISDNQEFVSVIKQDIDLNYGIDFKNIKILDNDDTIEIYNLEPTFTGFDSHPEYKCLFAETRESKANIFLSNSESFLKINEKTTDRIEINSNKQNYIPDGKEKHEKELIHRIKNGPEELSWLKEPIKAKSLILLKLFFPNKKIIINDNNAPENSILLQKIID